MKFFNIGIIGLNGHAGNLINILKQRPDIKIGAVLYPNKTESDLPITKNFEDLITLDGIIIASPTPTHFEFLRKLKNYPGYIFVEKPIVSTEQESRNLLKFSRSLKERIKVDYNLRHSMIFYELERIISLPQMGKIVFMNIHTSHGLAFQQKYKKSWRANLKKSFGVMEMVGVHYINLVIKLCGPIIKSQTQCRWVAGLKNGTPDTVFITLETKNGVYVNLFHSYAGPLKNRIEVFGTDGYWEYDGVQTRLYYPRQTIDNSGRFISPPLVETKEMDHPQIIKQSLVNSIDDFIGVIKKGGKFNINDFNDAIDSMSPVFDARTDLRK